jgi:hypothetical protein
MQNGQRPDHLWLHSGHALRTSSERRKSLLPSRREIKNRQFLFVQIKNSSKTESPLRSDGFRTARKPEGSPESESRPPTLGLFPLIKFTPITSVPPYNWGIRAHRKTTQIDHMRRSAHRHSFYGTRSCLGAIPRTTYRQLRIGLHLSLAPKRATGSRLS